MARGAEGKLRRRNQRKGVTTTGDDDGVDDTNTNTNMNDNEDVDDDVIDMFGTTTSDNDPFPSFPTNGGGGGSKQQQQQQKKKSKVDDDDDHEDHDDHYANNNNNNNLPKKSRTKTKKKTNDHGEDIPPIKSSSSGGGFGSGIKTTPLILLIMMIGTTLLPAMIFIGDYASSYFSSSSSSSSSSSRTTSPGFGATMGYYLGIGPIPNQRIMSFYEKHSPEKISDVPTILSKHYGQYPILIKKLERKYQDYGYFLGWEDDVTTYRMAMEFVQSTYDVWIQQYWNKYAPQPIKTAFRNVRYNITFLIKKIRKIWKRHIWPNYLQPIFGVPDGAVEQKRKDAADAKRNSKQRASSSSSSSRRKNTDFRDEEE